MPKHALS